MEPIDRFNMIFEENRIESYKKWPFTDKKTCNIKKLSEAGFFWTGTLKEPDSAQCFVCNKSLDGWEANDDPWYEHKKHSPNCLFVTIGKKENDLTVEQLIEIWRSMAKNLCDLKLNETKTKIKELADDLRQEILDFQTNKITK